MPLLDHAYFLLAAIAYPLFSFFSYRRLLAGIAAGQKVDRKTLYHSTILGLLLLFAEGKTNRITESVVCQVIADLLSDVDGIERQEDVIDEVPQSKPQTHQI